MSEFHINEFVVIDVETTGLSPGAGDRIVEVAALKIKNMNPVGQFYSLVDPQREISYGAFMVNGISREMLQGAPAARSVLPEFLNFIGDACLVGHNINFDLGFLRNELSLLDLALPPKMRILDTMKMARGLIPNLPSYSLLGVASFLEVDNRQSHRALADVELTCRVFGKLAQLAIGQNVEFSDLLKNRYGSYKNTYR